MPDGSEIRVRRVVALVLPELLCELANDANAQGTHARRERRESPFCVVLTDGATEPRARSTSREDEEASVALDPSERGIEPSKAVTLDAVNDAARRYGLYVGQTLVDALSFVARLRVCEVPRARVRAALGRVAEVALGFGSPVSIASTCASEKEPRDTVWVDVTSSLHLLGGEEALLLKLEERVRALGHGVRSAMAEGPYLAEALARWSKPPLPELPLVAFPLDEEKSTWLGRLGVLTLADVTRLPRAELGARLGEMAPKLFDWSEGRDPTPLVPYEPPRVLQEESSWEDALEGAEPLLFVLRGLCARLSARLRGRGEAAEKLALVIEQDRSIAKSRGVEPRLRIEIELSSGLSRQDELFRIAARGLERTKLGAPALGLRLEAPAIAAGKARQLDLSSVARGHLGQAQGVESLPVLLAELSMEVGRDRVGVLRVEESHRPEKRSVLGAASQNVKRKKMPPGVPSRARIPTRLLSVPLLLESTPRVGQPLTIDHELFSVESLEFEHRVAHAEWWTKAPVSRDYFRVWLESVNGGLEAWVYVDRRSGGYYLHAIAD